MRYAQRGGYTPAEQQRRERLRLKAAARLARGGGIGEIAHDLRVTEGSVRRWLPVGLAGRQGRGAAVQRAGIAGAAKPETGLKLEPW
jgi:hypothetical protein